MLLSKMVIDVRYVTAKEYKTGQINFQKEYAFVNSRLIYLQACADGTTATPSLPSP
jgi:hypothetical protein